MCKRLLEAFFQLSNLWKYIRLNLCLKKTLPDWWSKMNCSFVRICCKEVDKVPGCQRGVPVLQHGCPEVCWCGPLRFIRTYWRILQYHSMFNLFAVICHPQILQRPRTIVNTVSSSLIQSAVSERWAGNVQRNREVFFFRSQWQKLVSILLSLSF